MPRYKADVIIECDCSGSQLRTRTKARLSSSTIRVPYVEFVELEPRSSTRNRLYTSVELNAETAEDAELQIRRALAQREYYFRGESVASTGPAEKPLLEVEQVKARFIDSEEWEELGLR